MRIGKIINFAILTVIILLSLLMIATSLNLFGYSMYVVKSGSMEPALQTGSIVITKKQNIYNIGDIVTFNVAFSKDTVTHRIVDTKKDVSENVYFVVKGDANPAADPDPVAPTNIKGEFVFTIPFIGYLIAFIKTLPGLLLFIIVPATIIIYHEITNINTEIANIKAAKRKAQQEIEKIEDFAGDVIQDIVDEERKLVHSFNKSSPKKGARHG